ncbi:RHS repeat-associated protein, partial [Comamonas odontotermitis]
GQVAWQWLLSGFGEASPTTGDAGYVTGSPGATGSMPSYAPEVVFNLRYPGQQWDEETGLAYNVNRYYDRTSGRYIQTDPIGLAGGWSRFAYVGGNPLNYTDPLGLMTWQSWWDASVAGFQSETPWSAALRALESWPVGASMVGGAGRYVTVLSKSPVVESGGTCVAKSVANLGYDANKLAHVFKEKHLLDPLVNKFGSQEAAFIKMHEAAQSLATNTYQTGSWVTLNIDGIAVSISGRVINGEFRISTATMRPF